MDTIETWNAPIQNDSVREGLKLNQARYLRIVSRVTWQNNRYFQILGSVGITLFAFYMSTISPFRPYSYILGVVLVAVQWYVFSLYEKLRARIKADADESDPLAYFSRKLDIITLISDIRKETIINSCFLFTMIWAARTPERLFNQDALILGIVVILMLIALVIHHRLTVTPVMNYLKKLVKGLEEKNAQLHMETN